MTIQIDGNSAGGDRFDHIEATLAHYPDIDDGQLADLKRWFDREATAFEVASIASKDHLRDQYAQFRAAHLDRLGGVEKFFTILVAVIVLGGIAVVAFSV